MSAARKIPLGELEAEIEAEWLKLDSDGTILWSPASTPWLPTEWPADDDTVWVRYAYAQGMDPQLADAVRVALPWARAEARPREDMVNLLTMHTGLEEAGIQGVFPLPGDEMVSAAAEGTDLPPFLWQEGMPESGSEAEAKMRMAYRLWIRYNRVIADQVKDAHEAFLRWVELD
jgi:hypothetical protein